MQPYKDLKVWQRGHDLVLSIYRITKNFPDEERYGLVSQIRRAVVSVPTNIAEGSKRQGNKEFARFLNIAEASLAETEYLVLLSRDLGYLPGSASNEPLQEISQIARMLYALRSKVEQTSGHNDL